MNLPSALKTSPKVRVRETVIPTFLSLVGTIIVLFPNNPGNMTLPSRDSGVFLYIAWRFLSGGMFYRDVWDHKPPLVYFVDALGLTMTPTSLWGIWFLQAIFIFFTLFLVYKLLAREFGIFAALAGTITLTSGLLTILEKGNVTEEYPLVLQVLCFWLFSNAWKKDFPLRASFWIGVLGGLAFNFKQTTIGIWIAYALVLLATRLLQRKWPFRDLLSLLTGWLIPSIVLAIYLASRNALADYWQEAFLYNLVYIGTHDAFMRLVPVFIKGFAYLRNGWVLYLAILGWLASSGYVWLKRKSLGEVHPLIIVALLDLPIEVALITVSGRSILHYYLTPLPVMGLLAGVLIYTASSLIGSIPRIPSQKLQGWVPGILLTAVVFGQVGQISYYHEYICILRDNDRAQIVDYIAQNTNEDDKVLIIGAESVVNFLARRAAPTRYVYQYPLALLGRRPMFEEYFNQILENKPTLIIDTRGQSHLTDKLYSQMQKRSQIVQDGVKYLGDHYEQVAQFGDWFVYRLK